MSEFKKGDYIVFTEGTFDRDFPLNYVFKQRADCSYLSIEKDAAGDKNGWALRSFSSQGDWRYATDLEAAEYERLGKPFDVTTLKPKFEVGKWYKNLGSDNKYIVKFKEIKDGQFYSEPNAYYIYDKKAEMEDSGGNITSNYKDAIECSLSEIQQYLPDGHVDKIKTELTIDDLVEGEVYYCSSNGGHIYITESRGGLLFGDDIYINDHTYSNKSSAIDSSRSFSRSHKWEIRKADSDERQWLNACIEADKFIPKDEALNNEFVLPEKWCVKVDFNNEAILNKWMHENKDLYLDYSTGWAVKLDCFLHNFPLTTGAHSGSDPHKDAIRITFDQFKKYVLEEEVVKPKTKPKKVKKAEVKFNQWYKFNGRSKYLAFLTKNRRYGFNTNGNWFKVDSKVDRLNENWIEASKEEVEARLIEYAKKKYKPGDVVKSDSTGSAATVEYTFSFDKGTNSISVKCKNHSFENVKIIDVYFEGKWAEIIKEEVKVSDKRGVQCENQAEWDFVRKIYGTSYSPLVADAILRIDSQLGTFDGRDNAAIITFQQWLDEFGHNEAWKKVVDVDFDEVKPEFKVGDWVTIIQSCDHYKKSFQIKPEDILNNDKKYHLTKFGCKWIFTKQVRNAKLFEIDETTLSKPLIPKETNIAVSEMKMSKSSKKKSIKIN